MPLSSSEREQKVQSYLKAIRDNVYTIEIRDGKNKKLRDSSPLITNRAGRCTLKIDYREQEVLLERQPDDLECFMLAFIRFTSSST